jgi:hypothetical protein
MRWLAMALLPPALVAVVFVAVLRVGTPAPLWRTARPDEPYRADRCTWHCHNHGCPHATHLPAFFSHTLFDRTVLALHAGGDRISGGGFAGYRAINLAVFCAAWPGLMYALYLVALAQRRKLRAR